MTDTLGSDIDADQVEVMQAETVFRTKRALLLQAKAHEMQSYFLIAKSLAKTSMVKDCYQWDGRETCNICEDEGGAGHKHLKPVHDLAGAMMYGAKLGIDVEDAGQMIIMIKGQPSMQASDQVGLIRTWCDKRAMQGLNKPFLEGGDWIWEVESDDKHCVWAARRNGDEKSVEWTMTRAEVAGYTNDVDLRSGGTMKSKYKTIPIEMLRARAQSEVARLQFKDVLRGMAYSAEELQLEQLVEQTVNRPVQVQGGKGMAALGAKITETRPENHPDHHRAGFAEPESPADPPGWAEAMADEAQETVVQHGVAAPPGTDGGYVVTPQGDTERVGTTQNVSGTEAPDGPLEATDDPPGSTGGRTKKKAQAPAKDKDGPDEHGLTVLHTAITKAGFTHRSHKLGIVGGILGRPIESTKDLTDEELGRVNHEIRKWVQEGKMAENCRAVLAGDAPAAADNDGPQPATTKELQSLRKAYRDHLKITGPDLLPHLSNVLGWDVDDINKLSGDDVAEAIRVAEGKANRG